MNWTTVLSSLKTLNEKKEGIICETKPDQQVVKII